MSGNKKPSGAFHRKRKLERSKEDEKQSKVLQKFLTTASSSEKIDNTTNKVTKPDGNEKEILSENTSLLPEPPVIDKSVEVSKEIMICVFILVLRIKGALDLGSKVSARCC